MRRKKRLIKGFSSFSVVAWLSWIVAGCGGGLNGVDSGSSQSDSLRYVGRTECIECHEEQYTLFLGSDHDRAMDRADSSTVLGNFNNVYFTHLGVVSRFYRKGGQYYVYTEGPEGVMGDYRIEYTFGIYPLQQYLVAFPGGRYQCLPLCWDARPLKEGGQKWFHIYGSEKIVPGDFLYWTRVSQNWNFMCAECHSTDLHKNFSPDSGTYNTTWTEIDVSCEACHGPCSAHVEWAKASANNATPTGKGEMGLVIRYKDTDGGLWVFRNGATIAQRTVQRKGRKTIEMCARCHSRRLTIDEKYAFGQSLLNTHRPSLLMAPLYFPDGQIRDEVYVYASFLQSRMSLKGVICSDCHNPHSTTVYVEGNGLCYRCHMQEFYGAETHHFHKEGSDGSKCVECHMPERTYMQVDPRRDHSMRNPRPDLSLQLGTPNACTKCHTEKSDKWATKYFFKWYGQRDRGVHYGEIFWKARSGNPGALAALVRLSTDTNEPVMVRSTAFSYLSSYSDPMALLTVSAGLKNTDPLIRYGAFEGSRNLAAEQKADLYGKLLFDSVLLLRTQAARNFPLSAKVQLTPNEKNAYDRAFEEYLASEKINADVPSTWINLGNFYLERGQQSEAEASYRKSIAIEPSLPMGYINLADLYRTQGNDDKGERVIRSGLVQLPGSAALHHALGLLLVRQRKLDESLPELNRAVMLDPEEVRYAFVYGVALYSAGQVDEAITILEKARRKHPSDRDILQALYSYYMNTGQKRKADEIMQELIRYYPKEATSIR